MSVVDSDNDLPIGFDDELPEGFDPGVFLTTNGDNNDTSQFDLDDGDGDSSKQKRDKEKARHREKQRRQRLRKANAVIPPDHLRSLMNAQYENKQPKESRKLSIIAAKLMPLAMQKLLENIPMPWERTKKVPVVYDVHGVITIVDGTPKVSEPVYKAQWGSVWTQMRAHKVEKQEAGGHFNRISFPIRDPYDPPMNYADYLLPLEKDFETLIPIRNEFLDDEDDKEVINWIYETHPGPLLVSPNQIDPLVATQTEKTHFKANPENGEQKRGGRWYFTVTAIENLLRLAEQIINTHLTTDPNWFFLWDMKSFYTAKAMHVAIPRAPRFEALHLQSEQDRIEQDEDWTEFNDLNRLISRNNPRKPSEAMATERQIQFPYLYSKDIRGIHVAPYHYPSSVLIEPHPDESLPCFMFDHSVLNPIPAVKKNFTDADIKRSISYQRNFQKASDFETFRQMSIDGKLEDDIPPGLCPLHNTDGSDNNDFCELGLDLDIPDDFEPFLSELELEAPDTRHGLKAAFSPFPFNSFSGGLKRRLDVSLADEFASDPLHLLDAEYPPKVRDSYTRLLKGSVKRSLQTDREKRAKRAKHSSTDDPEYSQHSGSSRGPSFLDKLKSHQDFMRTEIDWLEAGLILIRQGHTALRNLLNYKGLPYVHITYNFNSEFTKTPTTQERKKSRLGPAYHLLREFLKLTKFIVDIHVEYRRGQIDAYQLSDGLHYLFAHVGKITGIYQYKHRTMRQARKTRDLKRLLYYRFNVGEVQKGPGNGFWGPAWRVWMFLLRGMTPLMHRFVGNLVNRMLEGRHNKVITRRVTKQRIESDMDVNIKDKFRKELLDVLPEGVKHKVIVQLDQMFNNAFQCWKKHVPCDAAIDPILKGIIRKYVKQRAENYVNMAQHNRKRINSGDAVDKTLFRKNLGRLTRLKLMEEQDRQEEFKRKGPTISAQDATAVCETMEKFLQSQNFTKIPFPKESHPAEGELLSLSLFRLREQHNIQNRLKQGEREEQKRIEDAHNNLQETLGKYRDLLIRQRQFKPIKIEYIDSFSHLTPIYTVSPQEKMIDAYLDQYLCYEASERNLFPNWVKPNDAEPIPVALHQWCDGINNSQNIWETKNGEKVAMFQTSLGEDMYDCVDWTLFRHILELIMDKTLVDYIVAHHNVTIKYKDMEHIHMKGLIRGLQFSGFLSQVWGLAIDLFLLGFQRAQQLAGISTPNRFMQFSAPQYETCHPIRGYSRLNDTIHILLRLTKDQAEEAASQGREEEGGLHHRSVTGFKNKKCWPRDCRMRLYLPDVDLARGVFAEFQNRMPPGFPAISWSNEGSFVSVYSENNPNLLFDFGGFEVRIQPVSHPKGMQHHALETNNMWTLRQRNTGQLTARAYLQVTRKDVLKIQNKVRHAIMTVGNATFQAIAAKWNATITGLVPYYREAIGGTNGLQEIFAKGEKRMQKRVMMALNTKAAVRFPPVIFYAPEDPAGGLGMMSIGYSMIAVGDDMYGPKAFMAGLTTSEDVEIPNVLNYCTRWEEEIVEGARAWREYGRKKQEAKLKGIQISFNDISDLLNKGIPRIRTEFDRNSKVTQFDRGFRCRQEFQQYIFGKFKKNWWFSLSHDGGIGGNFSKYKTDMIEALGGVEKIIEHSLFKGTGLPSWEGIYWNSAGSFEQNKKDAKLTKAQRGGLTQVPNERFALWWSPTINRSKIFTGYENKIQQTGILMHGKLETIKKSLVKLFLPDRWEKIHLGVVRDITQKLRTEDCMSALQIRETKAELIHHQKSYRMDISSADIVLHAFTAWKISREPSNISDQEKEDVFQRSAQKYWIDVRLRWGNYDKHNVALYARECFVKFTNDGISRYPSAAGVILAIDLAYNCWSAYGYWFPGMKEFLRRLANVIVKNNSAVVSLRDRLKRALQLKSSNPTEANLSVENFAELFSDQTEAWIVDDSQARFGKKNENGAVIILNPRRGELTLCIVNKSLFTGQKRAAKLAAEKSAEIIAGVIDGLPEGERPHKIVVTRSKFRGLLTEAIPPNIVVTQSDLNMPISQLLFHPKLGSFRTSSTTSVTKRFNLYDDWIPRFGLSPETVFRFLFVILRAYFVQISRAREIMAPTLDDRPEPHHFWPSYPNIHRLAEVTDQLQEMILADACERLRIRSPKDLTSKDKEDIIMGKDFSSMENIKEQIESIEQMQKTAMETETSEACAGQIVVNSSGEVVSGTVKKVYDLNKSGIAVGAALDWRANAVLNTKLPDKFHSIDLCEPRFLVPHVTLPTEVIIPVNLMKKFVQACDHTLSTIGYLFGRKVPQSPHIKEVHRILVPPQKGTFDYVITPTAIPLDSELLDSRTGIQFLGIIRIGSQLRSGEAIPNASDLLHIVSCVSNIIRQQKEAEQAVKEGNIRQTDDDNSAGIIMISDEEDEISVFEKQGKLERIQDILGEEKEPFVIIMGSIRNTGRMDDNILLRGFSTEEVGLLWAKEKLDSTRGHKTKKLAITAETTIDKTHLSSCGVQLSDQINGCFLLPINMPWNYYNKVEVPWEEDGGAGVCSLQYIVGAADCVDHFYSNNHHIEHFHAFMRCKD